MQKFLAYSKSNWFFLMFVFLWLVSTPFYWQDGGDWCAVLGVLVLIIYIVAVCVKIRRGQL